MTTHLSLRHPPSKPQADRHTHSQSQHPTDTLTHTLTGRPLPLLALHSVVGLLSGSEGSVPERLKAK